MTTEDMISHFIDEAVFIMKKKYKNTLLYRKIQRHETVKYEGNEFNYWREFGVYTLAKWISEILPDVELEVTLEGNDSSIKLELTEEQQRILNQRLFVVLKKNGVA